MSFDRLAPHYRWMEWLAAGSLLQRCRIAHLGKLPAIRNGLFLGEGNGRFAAEFLAHFPSSRITCVDSSEQMLQRLRQRLKAKGMETNKVTFIHTDALQWKPQPSSYDLIVTHFFLDCFVSQQLQPLILRVSESLEQGGYWLVSDFSEPPRGFWKWRARIILHLMYHFFRITARLSAKRLISPDRFLRGAGLKLEVRVAFEQGLLHSDCWRKLCH